MTKVRWEKVRGGNFSSESFKNGGNHRSLGNISLNFGAFLKNLNFGDLCQKVKNIS